MNKWNERRNPFERGESSDMVTVTIAGETRQLNAAELTDSDYVWITDALRNSSDQVNWSGVQLTGPEVQDTPQFRQTIANLLKSGISIGPISVHAEAAGTYVSGNSGIAIGSGADASVGPSGGQNKEQRPPVFRETTAESKQTASVEDNQPGTKNLEVFENGKEITGNFDKLVIRGHDCRLTAVRAKQVIIHGDDCELLDGCYFDQLIVHGNSCTGEVRLKQPLINHGEFSWLTPTYVGQEIPRRVTTTLMGGGTVYPGDKVTGGQNITGDKITVGGFGPSTDFNQIFKQGGQKVSGVQVNVPQINLDRSATKVNTKGEDYVVGETINGDKVGGETIKIGHIDGSAGAEGLKTQPGDVILRNTGNISGAAGLTFAFEKAQLAPENAVLFRTQDGNFYDPNGNVVDSTQAQKAAFAGSQRAFVNTLQAESSSRREPVQQSDIQRHEAQAQSALESIEPAEGAVTVTDTELIIDPNKVIPQEKFAAKVGQYDFRFRPDVADAYLTVSFTPMPDGKIRKTTLKGGAVAGTHMGEGPKNAAYFDPRKNVFLDEHMNEVEGTPEQIALYKKVTRDMWVAQQQRFATK